MKSLTRIRNKQDQLRQRLAKRRLEESGEKTNITAEGPIIQTSIKTKSTTGIVPRELDKQNTKTKIYLLRILSSSSLILPIDTPTLNQKIIRFYPNFDLKILSQLLQDLEQQSIISLQDLSGSEVITFVNRNKILNDYSNELEDKDIIGDTVGSSIEKSEHIEKKHKHFMENSIDQEVNALLNQQSVRERELCQVGSDIELIINKPTAKEIFAREKFQIKGGSAVTEYCPHITRECCRRERMAQFPCRRVHFRRIIMAHTEISLGDCSYLDACRHMKTCKFVHYEKEQSLNNTLHHSLLKTAYPAQWINCDVRKFKFEILGKFTVIMADPPWDIHMKLPYGTLSDDEMLGMNIQCLSTDGLLFLWVTGRAMELGRECLEKWGYRVVQELLWIKTNQLHRLIRTGRTGHWLNHSKEHCLIGLKGNPVINKNIDCDVIVSEVRETSRKPDEIYGILERLAPQSQKLELFGRTHNTCPGWITLGNQLKATKLADPELIAKYKIEYPDDEIELCN